MKIHEKSGSYHGNNLSLKNVSDQKIKIAEDCSMFFNTFWACIVRGLNSFLKIWHLVDACLQLLLIQLENTLQSQSLLHLLLLLFSFDDFINFIQFAFKNRTNYNACWRRINNKYSFIWNRIPNKRFTFKYRRIYLELFIQRAKQ